MNKYMATGWMKISEKDNFENGCYGQAVMNGGHDSFTGATIEDLIKDCMLFAGTDDEEALLLDSCEELGRLDIQVYENDEGYPPSKKELELFKEGKLDLWLSTYTFQALEVKPISLNRELVRKAG